MNLLASVRHGAKSFAWFMRGVMGEDAYDKYKAHHEAHDESIHDPDAAACSGPVMMTEREFWRDQTDRQDINPQGRCC
ncbi:YbdD/YjiX family protein [Cryobacterium sp. TMT1-62]|uniref:YbdD/YjiX family protein n=1 Tax=Cryobacterium sandaracinum TaxID=1259247 RepID=A0ABY2JN97_9MICO|nr:MULTISPECIES: YbdD/YjiX family protein [Cryobacterium]TFB57797.1 YbdD/YjiX family protein [Cryobacterium sp. Sr3]TFC38270.1 YbdD/YjiX family protein [Cryobacterium sp. TMT2-14]TFC50094.1 YbdD/YjiX family protein [Cryobacterium sp. TMT2-17-1]TFC69835.1 YbdD/YjiX family protein [Cryobacterium sp. TMT2-4]TFD07379.1 YbdD/YjiX family protein [Cryobacterium sandaracinum]